MTELESRELESQKLIKGIEEEFPQVLTEIPEYQDETDGLTAFMEQTLLAIKAQALISDVTSDSVDALKYVMADTIEQILVRAKSKAKSVKNFNLVALLKL